MKQTRSKAKVYVLQPGYATWFSNSQGQKADGTITLVTASVPIIIDTGLPKDKGVIINGLSKHNLRATDIKYVICTHGDADHTGNNNLFPNAKLIVGFDIYDGDMATFFQRNYRIDDNVLITEMIGHDDRSIGVLVQTDLDLVAITGDLFERKNDWKTAKDWIAFSKRPKDQIKNRARMWELATYIIPGHGGMLRVDKSVNILTLETDALKQALGKTPNVYGDAET